MHMRWMRSPSGRQGGLDVVFDAHDSSQPTYDSSQPTSSPHATNPLQVSSPADPYGHPSVAVHDALHHEVDTSQVDRLHLAAEMTNTIGSHAHSAQPAHSGHSGSYPHCSHPDHQSLHSNANPVSSINRSLDAPAFQHGAAKNPNSRPGQNYEADMASQNQQHGSSRALISSGSRNEQPSHKSQPWDPLGSKADAPQKMVPQKNLNNPAMPEDTDSGYQSNGDWRISSAQRQPTPQQQPQWQDRRSFRWSSAGDEGTLDKAHRRAISGHKRNPLFDSRSGSGMEGAL